MTIDECDEALIERLEPKPAPLTMHSTELISPLKFWEWDFEYSWQPISPLDSAECSERLLEAMPNAVLTRLPASRSWACNHDWVNLSGGYGFGKAFGMEHPNRRMAIFLAALKWQEIEEPTI